MGETGGCMGRDGLRSIGINRSWGGERVPPGGEAGEQDAGHPEGPPCHSQSPSPLRMLMSLFLD
ncbi:MAG TPA: hypothetical protein VF026_33210 [Ktedonobacteraceae bacterium]